MQFKKILVHTFLFLSILLGTHPLGAQVLRENEKGEKIIVYPDGRWQYFSDYSKGSKVTYGPEQSGSADNSSPDKYPIFEGKIAPLEGNIPITLEDLRKIADRRKQLAREAVDIAQRRAEEADQQLLSLNQQLQAARQKKDDDLVRQLSIRLDAAQKTKTETGLEARQALREFNKVEELTEKGNYVEEYVNNQKRLRNRIQQNRSANRRSYEEFVAFDNPFGNGNVTSSPSTACNYAYQGKDQRTGVLRTDLPQQLLFTHTDERLRLFLKDKEYLRCEGYFTATGGYYFLTFAFTFAYPNAREAYGFIEKGSILTVKLLNGEFINLQAGKMEQGSYDTTTELLTYTVHYPINYGQINVLKNSEVDTIRVFWSSGFEEYEVYYTDFFLNQIRCLEKL